MHVKHEEEDHFVLYIVSRHVPVVRVSSLQQSLQSLAGREPNNKGAVSR